MGTLNKLHQIWSPVNCISNATSTKLHSLRTLSCRIAHLISLRHYVQVNKHIKVSESIERSETKSLTLGFPLVRCVVCSAYSQAAQASQPS